VRIVDANVLLYAVNSSAEHHDASRWWLDGALSGADVVGLAWVPLPEDAMAQGAGLVLRAESRIGDRTPGTHRHLRQ
jgi:hypothetical protein